MYSNYTEETKPLFKLLRTEAFRFILVRFNHYSLPEQLKKELQERYYSRPVKEIDAANTDYRQLTDEYYALGQGFFIINNFEKVLDNPELYTGLNLRRDKLAQYPVAIICFVSPAANKLYARELMEKMPDLWSFRSLMLDLEAEIPIQEKGLLTPVDQQYQRFSTLGGFSQAEKKMELERLLLLAGETAKQDKALLKTRYDQIKDLQIDTGLYEDAITTINKLLQLADSTDDFASFLINRGDVYKTVGQYDEALKSYEEANATLETEGERRNLAISWERIGTIYLALGELEKALRYFEKFFRLSKTVYESNPNNTSLKHNLAISYEKIGDVYGKMGKLNDALKYFQVEITFFEELCHDDPKDISFKRGLAVSYSKLGELYDLKSSTEEALEYLQKAKALFDELHNEYPEDASFKHELAASYSQIGNVYETMASIDNAMKYYQDATKIFETLYYDYPKNVIFKSSLAASYSKLGDVYQRILLSKEALKYYNKDIELSEQLYHDYPKDVSFKNGIAVSFMRLAFLYLQLDDLDRSLDYLAKAYDYYIMFITVANSVQPEFLYNYAIACYYIGRVSKQLASKNIGEQNGILLNQAKTYLNDGLEMIVTLENSGINNKQYDDLKDNLSKELKGLA